MGGIIRAEPCTCCQQPTMCQWNDQPLCTLCLFEYILTERKPA